MRRRLARVLAARGGPPVPARRRRRPGERCGAQAAGACSPTSTPCRGSRTPTCASLVMQIAASEAEHLAALRLAAGEEPVPDAFAGFAEAGTR